ncbi:MAG: membrane protein insertase YidC [Vulcanibacillus sp.]
MNKKIIFILLLIAIVLLSTGCSAEDLKKPIDPNNGFWDKYFVYPISWTLDFFAGIFLKNYGISIIITTILIRLLVLPLMITQIKSTRGMQKLQPEITKLREEYKDDKTKMNEEYMKLLQKNNVNPLGGCLPIMVQMVVLIALYHAIIRNTHIAESTFLWLELGVPDPLYILPVLAAIATYFQTKSTKMVAATPQAATQQKLLLYFMPLMILFIGASLPSALALYWVVGNTFGIVQNLVVYKDKPKT